MFYLYLWKRKGSAERRVYIVICSRSNAKRVAVVQADFFLRITRKRHMSGYLLFARGWIEANCYLLFQLLNDMLHMHWLLRHVTTNNNWLFSFGCRLVIDNRANENFCMSLCLEYFTRRFHPLGHFVYWIWNSYKYGTIIFISAENWIDTFPSQLDFFCTGLGETSLFVCFHIPSKKVVFL